MALFRTRAVVLWRRALGETDRLVDFYTRDFGKVRGVARASRRRRARGEQALEPLALGELVFFDTGRSELVRVDQFDVVEPFTAVGQDLERLGRGAWVLETLVRLCPDRDPQPALFGLAVRSLRGLAGGWPSDRVFVGFATRAIDLLGHRPRLDACVACERAYPFPTAGLDMAGGGLVCGRCGPGVGAISLSGQAVGALRRLRLLRWDEGLRLPLPARLAGELTAVLESAVGRLMGREPRAARFLEQTRRGLAAVAEPGARGHF